MYLVRNGRSTANILLKGDGTEPSDFAARELRRYLRKMSGGVPKIVTEKSKIGGKSVVLSVRKAGKLSDEGFTISSSADSVEISSPSGRGLLFGVYAFLEYLGCRWCAPGDDFVPNRKTIMVGQFKKREQPDFPYRALSDVSGMEKDPVKAFRDRIDWAAKLRFNNMNIYITWDGVSTAGHGRIPMSMEDYEKKLVPEIRKRDLRINPAGHSFFMWLPPDKYFNRHPEYFSMIDGERKPVQICVSNAGAIDTVAANISSFLGRHPEVAIIDLSPMDGIEWCRCKKCREMDLGLKKIGGGGWFGDRPKSTRSYLYFVNSVSEKVRKDFPNVRFLATAYVHYIEPPEKFKASEGVWIDLYWYWRCYTHHITDADCPRNKFYMNVTREWLRFADKRVVIPEYHYGMMGWYQNPWPILNKMAHDWPEMHKIGVKGGRSKPGPTPSYMLNAYVFSRLQWDRQAGKKLSQILKGYCEACYGEAGLQVRRYYEALENMAARTNGHLEPNMKKLLTVLLSAKDILRLERIAARITGSSGKGPQRRRIAEFLKMHKHTVLCWQTLTHMEEAVRREQQGDGKGARAEYEKAVRVAKRSLRHYPTRGILRELDNARRGLGEKVVVRKETLAEAVARIAKSK